MNSPVGQFGRLKLFHVVNRGVGRRCIFEKRRISPPLSGDGLYPWMSSPHVLLRAHFTHGRAAGERVISGVIDRSTLALFFFISEGPDGSFKPVKWVQLFIDRRGSVVSIGFKLLLFHWVSDIGEGENDGFHYEFGSTEAKQNSTSLGKLWFNRWSRGKCFPLRINSKGDKYIIIPVPKINSKGISTLLDRFKGDKYIIIPVPTVYGVCRTGGRWIPDEGVWPLPPATRKMRRGQTLGQTPLRRMEVVFNQTLAES